MHWGTKQICGTHFVATFALHGGLELNWQYLLDYACTETVSGK